MKIHCNTCGEDIDIGYKRKIRWDSLEESCQRTFLPISKFLCKTFTGLEVRIYYLPVWEKQYHLLENHEMELR